MNWRPVDTSWHTFRSGRPGADSLPATFQTPEGAWTYGAASGLLTTDTPAMVRMTVTVERGSASICLLSEDYSHLASIQHVVRADQSEVEIEMPFLARKSPAMVLIRSADDEGGAEVTVKSVDIWRSEAAPVPIDYTALTAAATLTASGAGRYPLVDALLDQAAAMAALRPHMAKAFEELDVRGAFSVSQGLALAATVRHFRPDVILDLGTGRGGSAVALALADPSVPVYTFDNEPQWDQRVAYLLNDLPANVHPIVTDIVEYDYAALLGPAQRVMVFWDAHGFEIAARLFSHMLPFFADKPHVIFCHDIDDIRYCGTDEESGSYNGKGMWRGYDHYIDHIDTTDKVRVGWMWTGMDQAVALADFTSRNRVTVDSVDHEIQTAPQTAAAQALFQTGELPISMAYFTLNETSLRHFPAR